MAKELAGLSAPVVTSTRGAAAGCDQGAQDGNDIDYEGASGPIDLNEGPVIPTAGVYDEYRFRDGKVEVFSQVPVEVLQ